MIRVEQVRDKSIVITEDEKKDKNIFKQIIIENWENFKKKYPSYNKPYYEEVIQKALLCGTEQGGYTEYRCLECGKGVRRIPFTCKSCFCLSCAKVYTDEVVSQVSKMLRPGMKYRHIVLTIPGQLRKVFYKDRHNGKLLSELMRVGYKCVEEVIGVVVKREVKTGMIMVQHIFPKGFQRIRYYGLQATKTYKKWDEVIKEGLKNFGKVVQGVYEVVSSKDYRERYMESSGKDPLACSYCGREMKVWRIWHPVYGVIYDEEKNIRQGKYEKYSKPRDGGGSTVRESSGILQISMFPLPI